jgi:hypothetical protein
MSTISSSTTSTTAFGVTADTTGALVIQTGATPTTAMTITNGQLVGIGDTNPQSSLAVNSTTNPQIRVAYTGVHTYGVRATSGGNFAIQDTDASSADRLIIDTSGRITMPYQPGFAYVNPAIGYVATNYLVFSSGSYNYNIGNMLSLSGGTSGASRVTFPVSGYYYVGVSIMGSTDGSRIELFIRKNGSDLLGVNSVSTQYNNANINGICYFAANDYIEIWRANGTLYTGVSNSDIFWTVRLLG